MKLAIDRSAQRRNRELGDIERHAVGAIGAASADAGSVEPVIGHGDIRRGVSPGHSQAVIDEMPVAGEVDPPGGSAWFAQQRANILEAEVPAIAKAPIGMRKARVGNLGVKGGVRALPEQLGDRERIRLEREFHRQVGMKGQIAASHQIHLFPSELAQVHDLAIQFGIVDGKIKLRAFGHQGDAHIVQQHLAIGEAQAARRDLKNALSQRLRRGAHTRHGHIDGTVAFHAHMHHGMNDFDVAKGEFARPNRIDAQPDLQPFGVEKWRRPGGLASMDREIGEGHSAAARDRSGRLPIRPCRRWISGSARQWHRGCNYPSRHWKQ